MKIAEASPYTVGIFEACRLKNLFDFVPDRARPSPPSNLSPWPPCRRPGGVREGGQE